MRSNNVGMKSLNENKQDNNSHQHFRQFSFYSSVPFAAIYMNIGPTSKNHANRAEECIIAKLTNATNASSIQPVTSIPTPAIRTLTSTDI